MDLDVMKTQPFLSRIEIQGRLLGKQLVDTKNSNLSVGIFQHFDYFDSDTISRNENHNPIYGCLVPYKLGTPASIGGGVLGEYHNGSLWKIEGYAHLNAVLLAGTLSDFYRNYHRNYNWGSGFVLKGGFKFIYPEKRMSAGADARFYKIYTIKGYTLNPQDFPEILEPNVQGDRSNATFLNLNVNLNYRIWNNIYATAQVDWYRRCTHYTDLDLTFKIPEGLGSGFVRVTSPVFTSDQLGLKLMLSYHF